MSDKIISKVSCLQCKHFEDYGYEFKGEEVTTCNMGRYKEHAHAEQHGFITECDCWEAK